MADLALLKTPARNMRVARSGTGLQRFWLFLAAIGSSLAIWEVIALTVAIPAFFPGPAQVGKTAMEMALDGSLAMHAWTSLNRIFLGFVIGSAIAIPLGIFMGNVRIVRHFCEPYIEFFRYIPALSLVTVALIWFGLGEASKVFLIVYATTFIVVVNTLTGVQAIPEIKYRAARSLGVRGLRLFTYVSLPATIPFILTGMRIAMGNAFAVIVAAEMLGAQAGLGYLIVYSRLVMRTDVIFVAIISLGLLGLICDQLFRLFINYFGSRYSPRV
jgi:NitT/TauT family transport system permease protein